MKYKYILFDWDGCLAKTLDVWLSAYHSVFKSERINVTDYDIISKAFSQREKGMENLGSVDPVKSWENVVKVVNSNVKNVELYPHAKEVLEKISASGKKIGLLTSSDKATVMPGIEFNQLVSVFDAIVTKDDIVNKKPDPEQVNKTLSLLGGNVNEAIIIGDTYHDIQAGKNVGISTAMYYPKENEKFYSRNDIERENPDYIIYNLLELLKIVN